jgi:hypothetical protein
MKNKQVTHWKIVCFLFLLEAHSGGVAERKADSYLVLILLPKTLHISWK